MKGSIAVTAVSLLALTACGERNSPPATNGVEAEAANSATSETPDATQVGEAAPANSAASKTPPPKPSSPTPAPQPAAACQMQDGQKLTVSPLRAIGTEPFWGARIDGRCVTYSTPEDQAGTRVWTRFTGTSENGLWTGALDGRQFELKTREQPGCSDGMSDNRYPSAVTLRVRGETRTGCAKPA